MQKRTPGRTAPPGALFRGTAKDARRQGAAAGAGARFAKRAGPGRRARGEAVRRGAPGAYGAAAFYVAVSVIGAVGALMLGMAVTKGWLA